MSLELQLSKIGPESDALLLNLLQYYAYDLAEWFDIHVGADGRYLYDTAKLWKAGYEVYLAKADGSIAGFAIVGSARDWLGDVHGHDVHEFFVVRRFRKAGMGQGMAKLLWDGHPGPWLVRVLELNAPAVQFWRTVVARYSDGAFDEDSQIYNGRRWRFFRFVSNGG